MGVKILRGVEIPKVGGSPVPIETLCVMLGREMGKLTCGGIGALLILALEAEVAFALLLLELLPFENIGSTLACDGRARISILLLEICFRAGGGAVNETSELGMLTSFFALLGLVIS